MVFFEADKISSGGSATPAATEPGAAAAAATVIDYKTKLLALLGLDDTADEAAIDAKVSEVSTAMGGLGELQTKASSADDLQTKLDAIQKQYQELNDQQQALFKAKQEADADEILAVYKDCFTDDAARAAVRNILLSDKDAGIAILNGLKKPEVAAPEVKTPAGDPPAPTHKAKEAAAPSDEEKIKEQNALIKKIQGEGKFKDYTAAREEARRQKPTLFS